jgi:uncharacterized protein (TIGR02246 family)
MVIRKEIPIMKQTAFILLTTTFVAMAWNVTAQQTPKAAVVVPSTTISHQQDEQVIRQIAADFVKAYNAKDAKTIASLHTTDAEIVDEDGNVFQGRENIEKVFTGIFKETPKSKMEISMKSIRFVSPTTAIEDGTSTVTLDANEAPDKSRYMVVHIKQDGKWQMASARDISNEGDASEDQLQKLAWIIGDWVDESPDAVILTSYSWSDNHKYIINNFSVQIGGSPAMTGTQRIGWDPMTKQIRSWVFDSQGGFVEGVWTKDGNKCIEKTTGVTSDGKPASATNIVTMVSKDRLTWQSRDRIVGDEKRPDVKEVPIVRKPPKPM